MRPRRAGLARDEFEALLAALHSQREKAGEIYASIRKRVERFFIYRGASHPEELADETIDRVGRRLAKGESIQSTDAGCYFLGVARNVLFESWDRERSRPVEVDLEEIAVTAHAPDPGDDTVFACLDECLQAMAPESRHMVLQYFGAEEGQSIKARRALSDALGIEISVLRLRIFRFRARLEDCVRGCLRRGDETNLRVQPPSEQRGDS